jgi:hypothetical protein
MGTHWQTSPPSDGNGGYSRKADPRSTCLRHDDETSFHEMGHISHGFTGTRFAWLAVGGKRQLLEVCRIPAIQPASESITGGLCGGAGLLRQTAEVGPQTHS